jgi:alpha-glucosidase
LSRPVTPAGPPHDASPDLEWWREAVFYQVYPHSFADSGGDGVGDLPGITARLGHLAELGVDAVWLSPFYRSPMVDRGYDISDHCDVDPVFGTLADAEELLTQAHARGIRVMVDFVPNHTSDRHPWFTESRSSRTAAKRDWYVWADPAPDGGPPNNWLSAFASAGPAWTLDPATGQYYLHSYSAAQPDLNWHNPAVHAAMYDVLRFWLARGVDGVRVDAVHRLVKDPRLADNPAAVAGRRMDLEPTLSERFAHIDHPGVHAVLRELRGVLNAYRDDHGDRVAVGEVGVADLARWTAYYGAGDELHLAFCFPLWAQPWSAAAFLEAVGLVEDALPAHAWPAYALSGHDLPRASTRLRGPGDPGARARVAATMLLTLRGTPFLYYGEEIGMTDVAVPSAQAYDPAGRDPCRSPMQWDTGPAAGFTTGDPWLPVPASARTVNVAAQRDHPGSLLRFYQALLRLRRAHPALRRGSYRACAAHPDVFAYRRREGAEDLLVACSFADRPGAFDDPALPARGRLLLSTIPGRAGGEHAGLRPLSLAPLEAVVVELAGTP